MSSSVMLQCAAFLVDTSAVFLQHTSVKMNSYINVYVNYLLAELQTFKKTVVESLQHFFLLLYSAVSVKLFLILLLEGAIKDFFTISTKDEKLFIICYCV